MEYKVEQEDLVGEIKDLLLEVVQKMGAVTAHLDTQKS